VTGLAIYEKQRSIALSTDRGDIQVYRIDFKARKEVRRFPFL
jgi:hypothetical protein